MRLRGERRPRGGVAIGDHRVLPIPGIAGISVRSETITSGKDLRNGDAFEEILLR